jgi:pimeloyl-ACP methyl ester carboxylesterase
MFGVHALRVMNGFYPSLYGLDLREAAPTLDVPVYLVEGRYDWNAIPSLAVDYYAKLDAPRKELVWFDTGRNVVPDQPVAVEDALFETVLPQTIDN